jgi:two-component system OmpR family response regulator
MSLPPTPQAPYTLVVEDDPNQREAIVTFLNLEGIAADGVGSLKIAERWLAIHRLDVLIIDLGLPDGDGLEWIANFSDLRTKGIIVTTARGRPEERLLGVRAGVDSYLVKPIHLEELTAVVRNVYRRISKPDEQQGWTLDILAWDLTAPNRTMIKLSRSETLVLNVLAQCGGSGASREALIKGLGQNPEIYDWRRMEILVRRLRGKIEQRLGIPLPLRTIHGYGYAFNEPLLITSGEREHGAFEG